MGFGVDLFLAAVWCEVVDSSGVGVYSGVNGWSEVDIFNESGSNSVLGMCCVVGGGWGGVVCSGKEGSLGANVAG